MVPGVPDLLFRSGLSRAQADLKARLDRAGIELATGEKQDRFEAAGGDPSKLAAIDRSLARLEERSALMAGAKGLAEAQQTALGSARDAVGELPSLLMDATTSQDAKLLAREAENALGGVLGALNVSVAGRPLFAGASGAKPFPQAGELLDALDAHLTAAAPADAAEWEAALDDFFSPPPPPAPPAPAPVTWETLRRTSGDAPGVELADGRVLDYAARGDDAAVTETVRALAASALAGARAPAEARDDALAQSGAALRSGLDGLIGLSARLGADQSAIETSEARAAAETLALRRSREEIIGVDGFEAASRLIELETQLQKLYEVAARGASLSFVNFMR
jgi:flagellar hook-associated protein 3 FlgL